MRIILDNKSNYFLHPDGRCESDQVGEGTRIWGRAHVMKGAKVGKECNIGEGSLIENGASIGDYVTVKNGVTVWEGVHAEDYVFLGPHCILTNDLWPRSKQRSNPEIETFIRFGASIGAGAVIVCGNEIGRFSMVAAGALVTRDVKPFALVLGAPARQIGWICACSEPFPKETGEGDSWKCPRCGREFKIESGECRLIKDLEGPFRWHDEGAPVHSRLQQYVR